MLGNTKIRMIVIRLHRIKGMAALYMSGIEISSGAMPLNTKSRRPKGGDVNPMSIAISMIIPNHTGLI
jgi:hypothetical protein